MRVRRWTQWPRQHSRQLASAARAGPSSSAQWGPACASDEQLEALASGGMNVARLNMCHNTRDWHRCGALEGGAGRRRAGGILHAVLCGRSQ